MGWSILSNERPNSITATDYWRVTIKSMISWIVQWGLTYVLWRYTWGMLVGIRYITKNGDWTIFNQLKWGLNGIYNQWWFQMCFMFNDVWVNFPIWLNNWYFEGSWKLPTMLIAFDSLFWGKWYLRVDELNMPCSGERPDFFGNLWHAVHVQGPAMRQRCFPEYTQHGTYGTYG